MAQCVKQPTKCAEVRGCSYIAQWTFKNSGHVNWPEDVRFERIRGDDISMRLREKTLYTEGPDSNQMLRFTLELRTPLNPGLYQVTMGLVYGIDSSFQIGEDVTLKLLSLKNSYDAVQMDDKFCMERFFDFAIPEDKPMVTIFASSDPEMYVSAGSW